MTAVNGRSEDVMPWWVVVVVVVGGLVGVGGVVGGLIGAALERTVSEALDDDSWR